MSCVARLDRNTGLDRFGHPVSFGDRQGSFASVLASRACYARPSSPGRTRSASSSQQWLHPARIGPLISGR